MKVLLTGALSPLHWRIADHLSKGGHQVTLLGQGAGEPFLHTSVAYYDLSPNHPSTIQLLRTGRFEAIVFFFAYESIESQTQESVQGVLLDALFQYQFYAEEQVVPQFVLVTDARVFGREQEALEFIAPIPDTLSGIVIKAAEDCLVFSRPDDSRTLLLRVTNLYSQEVLSPLLEQVRDCAQHNRTLFLQGQPDSPCDFLHAGDLARFINLALDKQMTGSVHLAHDPEMTNAKAEEVWKSVYPTLSVEYSGEPMRKELLSLHRAKEELNWTPRQDWTQEVPDMLSQADKERRPSIRKRLKELFERLSKGKGMVWFEWAALGGITRYLAQMIFPLDSFRGQELWLFYVILMASLHGTFFGMAAALAACVSYGADFILAGNAAYLLLMDTDHWVPLLLYLLGGSVFGMIRQSMLSKLAHVEQEKAQSEESAAFAETMYQQAYEDRNRLQEQVMRTRDSYGRIYAIAKELDTLQPEQVFLSTLKVLEDTMQNQSVALYSCSPGSPFIRLVISSRLLSPKLAKSIDLDTLPQLRGVIRKGEVFVNTMLDPQYPSFAQPVMMDGSPVALVALWDVPFEKQTLYHRNLFHMVVGLVQSSMIRAVQYFGASSDVYLEDTAILSDKAFRAVMGIYRSMRKQRAASFLLLRVEGTLGELSPVEMDVRMRKAMRVTDIRGSLDNGHYYALLPQAGVENLSKIDSRFRSVGLSQTIAALESLDG